jgi:hypothetical protein
MLMLCIQGTALAVPQKIKKNWALEAAEKVALRVAHSSQKTA